MAQSEDLVATLKTELRRRGITYAGIAAELGLSESSVKRMFAGCHFSLQRLQKICDLVDLQLGDLVMLADERRRDVDQLTGGQEQTLVDDPKLLLVAFLLLNHWRVDQIIDTYDISELEVVQLLAKLDRLKVIDLLPGNQVRMRLSRTFSWLPDGPIQKFFETRVQSEFFQSRFDGPGELRLVLTGMLSDQSIGLLHQRMQRVVADFEQCVGEDRKTMDAGRLGTTLVMAIRPWALKMFESFRRQGN